MMSKEQLKEARGVRNAARRANKKHKRTVAALAKIGKETR